MLPVPVDFLKKNTSTFIMTTMHHGVGLQSLKMGLGSSHPVTQFLFQTKEYRIYLRVSGANNLILQVLHTSFSGSFLKIECGRHYGLVRMGLGKMEPNKSRPLPAINLDKMKVFHHANVPFLMVG